ncbi:MAG: C45 family autoproteolytic acyltransferase/hydrolase [Candidatus Odinarchaeia archaeon]
MSDINEFKAKELLSGAYRCPVNGWIRLHLHGSPYQIGFQHGYLMANEIKNSVNILGIFFDKEYNIPWQKFRQIAEELYMPKVPEEQIEEMTGIVEGAAYKGVKDLDLIDIIALNGYGDTLTYYAWQEHQKNPSSSLDVLGHCSAFIATGDATVDGKIVLAHNMWWNYILGGLFNIMMSIEPEKGHKMFIETGPGSIGGNTIDWDMNDAGIMVSETTITSAVTFNPNGTPYFVRGRKAIQYADSLDKWVEIMLTDNNGGFACDWLVGDAKTNEILWLELGTKHHALKRTKNGFFIGSNVALDPKVRSETTADYDDQTTSHTARYCRLKPLVNSNYGKIDIELGKRILADHYDVTYNKEKPSRCTVCGHIESDERGWPEWGCGPYYPFGTTDGKVVNTDLILKGQMWAHWGKPCGESFIAKDYFSKHKEYSWQEKYTKDIIAYPWTLISVDPTWR